MKSLKDDAIPERFIDEKLASHWQVNETEESFKELMQHLENTTNFKPYFEEALKTALAGLKSKKLVVLDLGSGVCWTSAIMAKISDIARVYAVEPSVARLKHAQFIFDHFKVNKGKIITINGSFSNLDIPEKADVILLCASIHHCYDKNIDALFSRLTSFLAPGGIVLLANEHYVDFWFSLKRFVSYMRNPFNRKGCFYSLLNLRAPYPFSGEHWRTKKELKNIFKRNGFKADFFVHDGDLCKDGGGSAKVGFHYYYAILSKIGS